LLQNCLAVCDEIGERRIRTYATINLGQIAMARGVYDQARQYLDQAFQITQELGDRLSRAETLREQGRLLMLRGRYGQATQIIEESLSLYKEIGRRDVGTGLSYLGLVLRLQGEAERAEQTLYRGLELSRAVAHQADIAANLSGLGRLACDRHRYHRAEQYFGQALEIWQQIGNEPAMAAVLCELGHAIVASGTDRQAEAGARWQQALQQALNYRLAPVALEVFEGLAHLLAQTDRTQEAIELLALAEYHSASSYETQQKAGQRLAALMASLSPEAARAAEARGQRLNWETRADS
jgi:tetratricopeptide (TPR) repeat protein